MIPGRIWNGEVREVGRNLIPGALISGWALWAPGAQSAGDPGDSGQHTPEFSYPRTRRLCIDGLTRLSLGPLPSRMAGPANWPDMLSRKSPAEMQGDCSKQLLHSQERWVREHAGGHWPCPCQFHWLFPYLVTGPWVTRLAPCNVVRETQSTFKDLESLPITTD